MHDVGLSEAHRFLQMLRHPQTIRLCWPGCRGPKPRIRSCKGCNGHGDWRGRQDRCSGGSNIRRSTTVAHAGAAREGARWAREARIEGRSDMQRRPIGATKVVTNVWPHFPSQPTCFSYIFPSFFALRWVTQKEFYMIASWLQVASSENCEFLSLQRLAAPCSALQVEERGQERVKGSGRRNRRSRRGWRWRRDGAGRRRRHTAAAAAAAGAEWPAESSERRLRHESLCLAAEAAAGWRASDFPGSNGSKQIPKKYEQLWLDSHGSVSEMNAVNFYHLLPSCRAPYWTARKLNLGPLGYFNHFGCDDCWISRHPFVSPCHPWSLPR